LSSHRFENGTTILLDAPKRVNIIFGKFTKGEGVDGVGNRVVAEDASERVGEGGLRTTYAVDVGPSRFGEEISFS
jgi:hypothetical protein